VTSFLQLLMLPWMAWSQRMRRIIARTLLVILCLAIAGYVLLRRSAGAGPGLAHGLAVIDCLFWAAVVPRALVLANEARRLRLPVLERAAAISTVLYAALTIVLPAVVVAMLGGSGVVALAELALGAGIGMGYAALPLWLGIWACLAPLLDDHLGAWLPMPASDPVGFLHWAAPVAAVGHDCAVLASGRALRRRRFALAQTIGVALARAVRTGPQWRKAGSRTAAPAQLPDAAGNRSAPRRA